MKKALIITSDLFPNDNAGATRQEILARLMINCGLEVEVIGMGKSTGFQYKQLGDNIKFVSLRENDTSIIKRAKGRILFSLRTKQLIQNSNKKYDVIMVVSVPYEIVKYAKKYARDNNAVLIHDSVEWYSSCEFKMGIFNPAYFIKNMTNTKWIDKEFNVIAISTFLQRHFEKRNSKCVRIPFVLDVYGIKPQKKEPDEDKVIFVYAGMIGRKDHLTDFLESVCMLEDEKRKRIRIELYGFDLLYLKKTVGVGQKIIDKLEGIVKIHGRVARAIVEEKLLEADFSILFRNPDERYAKAGFPTKIVESLNYATPVFCNLSSDLGMYLVDKENSIICKSESKIDIIEALHIALSLTSEERKRMQENARDTAIKYFDFKLYENDMQKILCK